MKHVWKIIGSLAIVVLVGVGYSYASKEYEKISPTLPPLQPIKETRWLNQNWSSAERYWFHHASQGTSTLPIPYKWFVSLAEPTLSLWSEPPLLIEGTYLQRMGFIPSPKSGAWTDPAYGYKEPVDPKSFAQYDQTLDGINPDGLPVGFAITKAYRDPTTNAPLPDQIGLTCAACHTGHLDYNGVSLRIDGANASVSLDDLTTALGGALALTDLLPWRFTAFADRVMGHKATDQERDNLRKQLKATLAGLLAGVKATAAITKQDVTEGFNRLDALNRIGNTVFYEDLIGAKSETFDPLGNMHALTAPVKYPHIWTSPWIDWVQYDGSILKPIIRNAGEAMGVNARINMTHPDKNLWQSSVNVKNLAAMEKLLAGPYPLAPIDGGKKVEGFRGLSAPHWPEDVLGKIDPTKRDRGRVLYAQHCQACHLPPVDDPAIYDLNYWTEGGQGQERTLKANLIPQAVVGTDPAQEQVLITRKITVPPYLKLEVGKTDPSQVICFTEPTQSKTTLGFGQALASAVQHVVDAFLDDNHIAKDAESRAASTDNRPNCIQAKPVYKARPLNGIWAVPPYLHNGSVPSLYALLGGNPAKDRPSQFCLGNRAYDPKTVGLVVDTCPAGTFTLDTSVPGNSNRGHEFRDGTIGQDGVIGPKLSEDDRLAIIEFLKAQ